MRSDLDFIEEDWLDGPMVVDVPDSFLSGASWKTFDTR
jgi:hypothetical protein